jgi:hypothetical protein
MRKRLLQAVVGFGALAALSAGVAYAAGAFTVKPEEADPGNTYLVQASWLSGIGCPTNAQIYNGGGVYGSPFTDPACPTGDTSDNHNEGLLLAKTGPTANFAAAVANIKGFPKAGINVTQLGYDLRKPVDFTDPRGSHCGAGAPRFDLVATDGTDYFVGCSSPPPTETNTSNAWIRLRWNAPVMAYGPNGLTDISTVRIKTIQIVFDEGQDTGPDNFGLAVLDNIDINGDVVGQGPGNGK